MEIHFIHNYYMAEIADCIINDKIPLKDGGHILFSSDAEYQVGVKEIVGLYLLIPYLNNANNQLTYDGNYEQIRIFDDDYVAFQDIKGKEIKIKDLRDTICHSFVSCDAPEGKDPCIVFDDRVVMSRSEHDKKTGTADGNHCILVKNQDVLFFLKEAFKKINDLMSNLL